MQVTINTVTLSLYLSLSLCVISADAPAGCKPCIRGATPEKTPFRSLVEKNKENVCFGQFRVFNDTLEGQGTQEQTKLWGLRTSPTPLEPSASVSG
jgi:hypothetical protein